MDEAEQLCDRLVVIDDKRVVAAGEPQELIDRYGGGVRVKFGHDGPDLTWLAEVPHVSGIQKERRGYAVTGEGPVLAYVAAALLERGLAPTDLRLERASLEDVFLAITDGNNS